MKLALLLTTLLFSTHGSAAPRPQVPDFKFSITGSEVALTPPDGHHFNIKAPVHVAIDGREIKHEASAERITAHIPADHRSDLLRASAFLCDERNSYCIKKSLQFDLSGTTAQQSSTTDTEVGDVETDPVKPHLERETGFLVNDPDQAFKIAREKNLPVVIDFFGIWCPPCNHLDAMVFHSKKFKTATEKRFVRLKLDTDSKLGREWTARFKIKGLPTVAFTTSAGEEITRVLGFRPLPEMMGTLNTVLAHPNEGFAQLEEKAKKGDNEARVRAARILLDRSEYAQAVDMLKPLESGIPAKDPRHELIYKAQLGVATEKSDRGGSRNILTAWLSEYPDSADTLENYQQLADLEDEAGNDKASKAALTSAVNEAERLIREPERFKNTDNTVADLRETIAELLAQLGDKEKATAAYLVCADAYQEQALAEKSNFPRGPNLERAYCLSKAGKLKEAEAILRKGIRLYPAEYTFHHKLSQLLLEEYKKPAEALPEGEKALSFAYGNQRLKVVTTLAKALDQLGQPLKAVHAIERELKAPQLQTTTASSVRLRKKLETQKEALLKKTAS